MLYNTQTLLGDYGKPSMQSENSIVHYRELLQLAYFVNNELIKSIHIRQKKLYLIKVTTRYQYGAFAICTSKHI